MIIKRLVFSPIEVNTYILIDDSGECAVIDCGCYNREEFSLLEKVINENMLSPVMLLNTHCHLDHIFGNRFMLERYNLKTLSSELDEMNRINSVAHAIIFGLEMDNPPKPGGFLVENQVVSFGSIELSVLHVPGHSPGGLAFYCKDEGCVFTGDALFSGSIGRSDLPGGNHDTLIKSIQEKLFTLPPATTVYPGHGEHTSIEREMKYNPYFS
jgi:hydroxyacylglutathione hydrolase